MALPPNGWPDNGPLHSTRESANHSYANGLSRQVQGQPPPPERWASPGCRFTDATRIHAQKYTRTVYAAIAHSVTPGQNRASLAGIYLPSWLSTTRGPRGTSTKNHFRPPTSRPASDRAAVDKEPILRRYSTSRIEFQRYAFGFSLEIHSRVKSLSRFRPTACLPFLFHDISKDKLKS